MKIVSSRARELVARCGLSLAKIETAAEQLDEAFGDGSVFVVEGYHDAISVMVRAPDDEWYAAPSVQISGYSKPPPAPMLQCLLDQVAELLRAFPAEYGAGRGGRAGAGKLARCIEA